jgi:hypothetical protein
MALSPYTGGRPSDEPLPLRSGCWIPFITGCRLFPEYADDEQLAAFNMIQGCVLGEIGSKGRRLYDDLHWLISWEEWEGHVHNAPKCCGPEWCEWLKTFPLRRATSDCVLYVWKPHVIKYRPQCEECEEQDSPLKIEDKSLPWAKLSDAAQRARYAAHVAFLSKFEDPEVTNIPQACARAEKACGPMPRPECLQACHDAEWSGPIGRPRK